MSSRPNDSSEEESSLILPSSDQLWRLLLGRTYDNLSQEERSSEVLLNEFYRRNGETIDSIFGSKEGLIRELQSDDRNSEKTLMTVWAEKKWQNKSPGDEFRFEDDSSLIDELDRIADTSFKIEVVYKNLFVIWTQKQVSRPREDAETVRSYLDDDWSPLIAKQKEPDLLEVRGARRRRYQLSAEFAEEGRAKKVQKELSEESVLDDLSSIFGEELASMDLIEVRFRQSRLPNGSQLTLRNDAGVQEDLKDESINPEVISPQIASRISYLKFRDHQSDNIAQVNVNRRDRGFSFEIRANYISDEETKSIQEVIEDKFGISFNKTYPYHLQYQADFILHQILSGSVESYETYYTDLEEADKKLIDEFINHTDDSVFVCWSCRAEFEEKPDACEECGNDSFEPKSDLEIHHDAIYDAVVDVFEEFEDSISYSEGNVRFDGLQVSEEKIGSSRYIKTLFRRTQDTGQGGLRATQDYRYEYFVYPLAGRKPQRIGQYLLNTVLITYGTAYQQELANFGSIHLIELLRSNEPEKLFVQAVEGSHRGRPDRYRQRAKRAVAQLKQLQSKIDTGEIDKYDSEDDAEDAFLDDYSAKKFERDVFHLLKSIFMSTERWGREGKKETDGCLIIPKRNGEYWVGGYDPKLTTDPKGYNIRSTEKDKVAYYVLDESDRDYIKNVLKRGDPIDAHIFVSDIFREGQFKTTADRVDDWFSLTKRGDERLQVPIIFIRVEHLLKLYDIFDSNYTYLREYPGVMEEFMEAVSEQLSSSEGYIEFDDDSCQVIRERVVRELDIKRKDRDVQEYSGG